MTPDELINQLAPLRPPAAIGWWPLATGWWLLLAVLLTATVLGVWWLMKRRNAQRYRREALRQLNALCASGAGVAELNGLLKAVAIYAYGSEPARLSGSDWVIFLGSACSRVTEAQLAPLATVYGPQDQTISDTMATSAKHWIQHHEAQHV